VEEGGGGGLEDARDLSCGDSALCLHVQRPGMGIVHKQTIPKTDQ
jgi:hypothetical protein